MLYDTNCNLKQFLPYSTDKTQEVVQSHNDSSNYQVGPQTPPHHAKRLAAGSGSILECWEIS